MIYCISDIHGRLDLFEKMLDTINLTPNDTLYILGDTIDRGGGLSVLRKIKQLSDDGIAKLILGNHEHNFSHYAREYNENLFGLIEDFAHQLVKCVELNRSNNTVNLNADALSVPAFEEVYNSIVKSIVASNYLCAYSGYQSYCDYRLLSKKEKYELLKFIDSAPMYVDIVASGKSFRLVHAGLDSSGNPLLDVRYDFYSKKSPLNDTTIVFGHTTTKDIRIRAEHTYTSPTIWFDTKHDNDKIGIDCGACYCDGKLACLRLDDMTEYYVDNTNEMSVYVEPINSFSEKTGYPVNILFAYMNLQLTADEKLNQLKNEEKERYGEYYEPYISKYPSLSKEEKDEWYSLLKWVDNNKKLVDINSKSQKYKKMLSISQCHLSRFHFKHAIHV